MQRLITFFSIAVLVIFLVNISSAASKKTGAKTPAAKHVPAKLQKDTSTIQVKNLDANAINKFKADKAFNYDDRLGAGEPSLWDRFWEWVWYTLFGWIGRTPYGGTIIEYILLIAGVLLIIYVISKSLGIDIARVFRGESARVNVPYTESLENIHEINFDAEIEKAIAQNNYRLAVRMLYLKSLKLLSDAQLIHWQIDKTNSAYLNELGDPAQKQTFGLITRQFEYVWYGNFAIDKQAYGNIDQLFHNFKKMLP